jgi:DNA-binding response OmpR family regulator
MPGASGFQVCEAMRQKLRVPVMMLTARGEEQDLVRALELGADDYLTKPFSPRTLLARVKALLRRAGGTQRRSAAAGRITLDADDSTVRSRQWPTHRADEAGIALLQMLLAQAGHRPCTPIAC